MPVSATTAIAVRAQVRTAFADGKLTGAERSELAASGLSAAQLAALERNRRDGGALTDRELTQLVNTGTIAIPTRGGQAAAAGAAAGAAQVKQQRKPAAAPGVDRTAAPVAQAAGIFGDAWKVVKKVGHELVVRPVKDVIDGIQDGDILQAGLGLASVVPIGRVVRGAHLIAQGVHSTKVVQVTSHMKADSLLVREARAAARNPVVQRDLDSMVAQIASGNFNPGIGTKALRGVPGVFEARSRNGARVYFRDTGTGVQIVAKSDKNNQGRVIQRLQQVYGR